MCRSIETKMNDAQFIQCADELVEFFVMVITERKNPVILAIKQLTK